MISDAVLIVHVAAGVMGLVLGPVAMRAPKRRGRHTSVGAAYQGAVAVLCSTSVLLALYDWAALWWLALIGVATQAAALAGVRVRRRRRPGWVQAHIGLMCGSYISFVTAFLVTRFDSPLSWLLPTVVGSPLIGLAIRRSEAHPPAAALA
jgi:hypothetical protein